MKIWWLIHSSSSTAISILSLFLSFLFPFFIHLFKKLTITENLICARHCLYARNIVVKTGRNSLFNKDFIIVTGEKDNLQIITKIYAATYVDMCYGMWVTGDGSPWGWNMWDLNSKKDPAIMDIRIISILGRGNSYCNICKWETSLVCSRNRNKVSKVKVGEALIFLF